MQGCFCKKYTKIPKKNKEDEGEAINFFTL